MPDLLESTPFDTAFVPEIDNELRAILRFGDDEYGQSIAGATAITATYRVGNGTRRQRRRRGAGPCGARWAILRRHARAQSAGRRATAPTPETIDDVRQWAPEAFRAVQFRAVTEADYARTAQLCRRC